jgi:CheY-like chemotaxis protein
MNIRSRLIFLVACVLLPAFGAGAISVWYVYAEEQRAQERTLSEAARVLAQLIDNELKSSARFLTALSASPDLAAGDLERFYQQAKTLSFDGRNTIVLSTPEGAQLLNTRLPLHAPARTINPRLIDGARHVDILFSDIVMPSKLNGVLLARHVRAHFPAIALVLATGYFDEKFHVADAPC